MTDDISIPQNKVEQERLEREAQRWEYVKEVARREGMSLAKAALHYNIDKKVIEKDELSEIVISDKKNRRKDKYATADKFCRDNVGTVVTPAQLAEVSGFSYPTAVKYINDHPHHFRKAVRGQYEIRDPKVDKKQEGNQE
jgi:hypothetical protein